jgi:hypothetical protein
VHLVFVFLSDPGIQNKLSVRLGLQNPADFLPCGPADMSAPQQAGTSAAFCRQVTRDPAEKVCTLAGCPAPQYDEVRPQLAPETQHEVQEALAVTQEDHIYAVFLYLYLFHVHTKVRFAFVLLEDKQKFKRGEI